MPARPATRDELLMYHSGGEYVPDDRPAVLHHCCTMPEQFVREMRAIMEAPRCELLSCVFTFDRALGDYRCIGVFTKREDAEEFANKSDKLGGNRPPIVGRTFKQLTDELVRFRLGRLADVLFAKEQAELDARQSETETKGARIARAASKVDRVATLYSN